MLTHRIVPFSFVAAVCLAPRIALRADTFESNCESTPQRSDKQAQQPAGAFTVGVREVVLAILRAAASLPHDRTPLPSARRSSRPAGLAASASSGRAGEAPAPAQLRPACA